MTNEEALRVLAESSRRSAERLNATGSLYMLQFVRQWNEIEMRIQAMLKDEQLVKRLRELDTELYEEASLKYNDALRYSKKESKGIKGSTD